MRRAVAILLTIMLALASFASTAHAMPHGHATHHTMDDDATGTSAHVVASVDAASSCCSGEAQRAGPACPMFLAVLPADASASRPALRSHAFAVATAAGEGLDPERLLDPPRS